MSFRLRLPNTPPLRPGRAASCFPRIQTPQPHLSRLTPSRYLITTSDVTTTPDTSPTAATAAASQFLQSHSSTILTRTQPLDAHHLQKLSLLLARPNLHPALPITSSPPPDGTPLPKGYHLIYFTPSQLEADLGADGTDTTFNAPWPFTRRMWAGGKMEWVRGRELRVGEAVEERSRVLSAVGKRGGDGRGMVLVEVEKVLEGKGGGLMRDVRSWIFRPPVEQSSERRVDPQLDAGRETTQAKSTLVDVPGEDPEGFPERHMSWSPVALFGFSALTFNPHKIHYNESWTRNVEGHPGLVVHGPLNLINMLDYWRDVHGRRERGLHLKEVKYRAMAPIYAGEQYRITSSVVEDGQEPRYELLVIKGDAICMRGEITAERS
ncbi:hypothetical protein VTI74DRAFT_3502 [Chaetomium olivicolor]